MNIETFPTGIANPKDMEIRVSRIYVSHDSEYVDLVFTNRSATTKYIHREIKPGEVTAHFLDVVVDSFSPHRGGNIQRSVLNLERSKAGDFLELRPDEETRVSIRNPHHFSEDDAGYLKIKGRIWDANPITDAQSKWRPFVAFSFWN